MKPEPPSAIGDAVGERGARGRDHLPPGSAIRSAPAGVDDDRRDHEPADDTAEHAVADLLQQERSGAATAGDRRDSTSASATAANSSGHADPVVEPALDVQPLADALGTRGSVTTAWPSAASVGARTTARISASSTVSWPNSTPRRERAERDRQRQADPEQAHRHRRPRAAAAPRSMREASANSTSASVASASTRTAAPVLDRSSPSSTFGPDQQPERDEHDRRRDRRALEPPRDRGDAEQRHRDESQSPLLDDAALPFSGNRGRSCRSPAHPPSLDQGDLSSRGTGASSRS